MRIGSVVHYFPNIDILKRFKDIKKMGLESCQLVVWNMDVLYDLSKAVEAKKAAEEAGIVISHLWCGYSGVCVWDFYEGQKTLGIVNPEIREQRTKDLLQGSEFAKVLGCKYEVTHVGYIPEDPYDPKYQGTLDALKIIISRCKENGQDFLFETGQETPVTLLRTIEDLGFDNVGINIDGANLILYGKASPVDALDVYGKWVKGVHVKDGFYPTDGHNLGLEVKVGKGKVNWPVFLPKLVKEYHYDYDLTIEREIQEGSPEQTQDIVDTAKYLREILKNL